MKTLKFFNYGLLIIAASLLVTAVFEFVNGNILHGICNILWMGCEVVFFSMNKIFIQIKQDNADIYAFLLDINDTIETYGSAIITEYKDGYLIGHAKPSCSAENNDQIEFTHISDNDKC